MGVRGLTTFIAANADKYLKSYELHDTNLVIDGNNLASHLYKWHAKCHDCFGGDYDKYAKTICDFFKVLEECNITPLIIFDGGYEDRKLKTVYSRIRNKVKQAQRLNCATEGSMTVFPLFLRDLFVEVVLKLQLKVVRCITEADYEMACIAKKLCCPLLSYDSDFYIFDVLYIPFSTLNTRSTNVRNNRSGITYKVMECQIYRIENFLQSFGGLQTECVPLLGVLLGNDYIKARVFKKFYEHIKLQKRKYLESDQQRRIMALIKWLQNETYESAVKKILGRIKTHDRKYVSKQIKLITEGYLCSESKLIQYLDVAHHLDDSNALNLYIKFDFEAAAYDSQSEIEESNSESDNSDTSVQFDFDSTAHDERKLPDLFEESYKRGLYPACFIDMIYNNQYFFIPQIESYSNESSHVISLNILSVIYKILSSCSTYQLSYILRDTNASSIRRTRLEHSSKQVPELKKLHTLTKEEGQKLLFNLLDIDSNVVDILLEFPASWRLYILSIVYWIQNVKPRNNNCHIYSVILSALALKHTGAYMHGNENKFLTRFHHEIQEVVQSNAIKIDDSVLSLPISLDAITKNDCIMFLREMISNFQIDQKLRKNPKLFNINIVHSFAQLQSCAFHIKYLNALLNNPFENYLISDFYNGTLTYNLCANFMNRSDLDAYVQLIFKYCPNILKSFQKIKCLLSPVLSTNVVTNTVVKRKRKKTDKQKIYRESENRSAPSDDENSLFDVNNRFSALALLNK